jgi:hypothetical protein
VIRRCIAFVAVAGAVWPATGWAQPQGDAAPATPHAESSRADALFNEAKDLRDAGNYATACPKFAESRGLANGVGVTLYLADCYQKVGRTQSAWTEFRNAERLARDKGDKRADVAAARAAALEPTLNRVTLALPPLAAGQAAPEVTIDGIAVPPEQLNAPLAMDPGDHELKIVAPGGSARALAIHVDPSVPSLVVPLAEPEPAGPAPAEAAAAPPPAAPAPLSNSDPGAARRWVGFGLIAAGAGAGGIATWLLTSKVTATMANGSPCDPELRTGAQPAAAVLFVAGGVAVISGIVLAVTASHHAAEVALAPVALPGGGGAFIGGAF